MMENEATTIAVHDDTRASRRGRLMGKLFGRDRDRKTAQEDSRDLNEFLHGAPDQLQVAHAGPPVLAKLDTKNATRYPNAHNVRGTTDLHQQQDLAVRTRSLDPGNRPKKKGLIVKFADTYPEIIGNGGDECDIPTLEISKRKRPRAQTVPTTPARPSDAVGDSSQRSHLEAQARVPPFEPGSLRRTQTGYIANSNSPEPGRNATVRYLGSPAVSHDERRRSFIEIHQAEMRNAEGRAFAKAVRAASGDQSKRERGGSSPPPPEPETPIAASPDSIQISQLGSSPQPPKPPAVPVRGLSQKPQLPPGPVPPPHAQNATPPQKPYTPTSQHSTSPERLKRAQKVENSPQLLYSPGSNFQQPIALSRQNTKLSEYVASPQPQQAASSFQDVVVAASDDAMNAFVTRTRHLFELFRLHAESVRPLISSTPHDLARAALWWFLRGRTALEVAVRDRPNTPESERKNEMAKQQAYADLAKGYWLLEEVMSDIVASGRSAIDSEAENVRVTLVSSLRKLAVSMKRNGFLPPEEAFLPQTVDRSIWTEYPPLTQDIKALLCGSTGSALASQQATSGMTILECFPLGDSATAFCFARFQVDVFLMEQGRESQRLYLPCFLSIVRPQTQPDIMFVLASQNGAVQLRISANKNTGPVWEDVRWRLETFNLEVRLPRGFMLIVQCTQHSYSTLRSMYEFSAKVHASLYPRQDENCTFRSTLRAFQYFDNDPQARQFPKESTPNCEIALFERVLREGAATGPRTYHRGFRIAVVTGPRTKTLSGVNQMYSPQAPIQFGFLRSEANDPALSLKFDNGRLKGNMVLSFADEKERLRMHSLLIGTALDRDERVFGESAVQGVWFSERFGDTAHKGMQVLSSLAWNKVRVINHDNDGDRPLCVLADKLRVVYEFKDGTLTDRINVAPGELKLRLDVQNPSCLMVFRQPQADITLAVTEAKASRDLSGGLTQALESLKQTATIRTFMFPKLEELHAFETAITGFKVLFDGIASAFAISRRRMVVPIHKKWEAGATRIQVVSQDGVAQLLAFFEDFSHGRCMGFHLKGTDVFESFSRGSKTGLKIVDAKFPLPKVLAAEADGAQEAADAAFLCLDLPELPGEHDDISILFDNEAERDKLIACLPAPVKGSRLPKIKGIT
ncbi:Trans-sulfuration enzyme protein [Madurella fahalii]|uniref:Trans-sulfuration enzyme protein n=1 Tax=Madurella fahalii TaxID=1157608 RepID=A0ABQ0FX56_9PEZI